MSDLLYDWMGASSIIGDALPVGSENQLLGAPIVQVPNGPYAAGSTPIYAGQIIDPFGVGIPAADISILTLSIVDTLSQQVINGVSGTNILNTGRGTVDDLGNLKVSLEAADTSLAETDAAQIQRSLIFDWTYATMSSAGSGRHQVNFILVALAGA